MSRRASASCNSWTMDRKTRDVGQDAEFEGVQNRRAWRQEDWWTAWPASRAGSFVESDALEEALRDRFGVTGGRRRIREFPLDLLVLRRAAAHGGEREQLRHCDRSSDPHREVLLRASSHVPTRFPVGHGSTFREATIPTSANRSPRSSFRRRARRFVSTAPAMEPRMQQQARPERTPRKPTQGGDDRQRRRVHSGSVPVAVNETEQYAPRAVIARKRARIGDDQSAKRQKPERAPGRRWQSLQQRTIRRDCRAATRPAA